MILVRRCWQTSRSPHQNWNLPIDGDSDDATMTCYLAAFRAGLAAEQLA